MQYFDTKQLYAEFSAIPVADVKAEVLPIVDHINRSVDLVFTYCQYYQEGWQNKRNAYKMFEKLYAKRV